MRPPAERVAAWFLFVCVTAVYAPSAGFGFLYDDVEIIVMQEPARSLGDVVRIFGEPHGLPLSRLPYYRAPTRATLLVQKGLHGDRPGPFHAANALLMGAVACAAYAILRHRRFGLSVVSAGLGAAIFALHPAASSTVYPVSSGRETLLPVCFALLAVAAWLRGGPARRVGAYAAFAVALLAKESSVVVPVLFVAADALRLTPDPPGRSVRAWALRHAPSLLVFVGYLLVRNAAFDAAPPFDPPPPLLEGRLLDAALGPLLSLLYFLQTWFAPTAHAVYEPPLAVWLSPLRALWAASVFGALVLACWRGSPRDRAPVAFFLIWVPVGMGLTLNLLPQEARFAERFLLLSSLAPAALVAMWVARSGGAAARLRAAAVLALVVGLAAVTLGRGRDYRDDLAFTSQWVRTNPAHPNAHYSLGVVLARRDRPADAMTEFREAIRIEPAFAVAHYNLAVLLARQGRREEAIAAFEAAIRHHPQDADAHAALAVLLESAGRGAQARAHRDQAARLRGDALP